MYQMTCYLIEPVQADSKGYRFSTTEYMPGAQLGELRSVADETAQRDNNVERVDIVRDGRVIYSVRCR